MMRFYVAQGDLNMLVFSDTGKAMHEKAEVI